jgi:GNAT superfamily N-acetyltransferase
LRLGAGPDLIARNDVGVDIRVEMLADHLDLVDTVIDWHWREWSHGHADASLDDWRVRLVARSNCDRVPFTLVAFVDSVPVGCVSVCDDDLDARFADHGPWLSGMLVIGEARDQGVGRTLVHEAEMLARQFGASELWLHTGEASAFYERCGWSVVSRKQQLHEDTVMRLDLAS